METSHNLINLDSDVNVHLENKKISRHFFVFIWLMYTAICLSKSNFNGALASIVSEGLLTKSQTGLITAVFYGVYAPLQIIGGMIADRHSPEILIKIGFIGAAISNAIIFFNQSYPVMLAAWAFNGMIQFGIWPGIFKIISAQLVRSDRKMMSYYISFPATAGLMISYLLVAILPHWSFCFLISAVLLLFFAVGLHIYEKHLNPYMKWDRFENVKTEHLTMPTTKAVKGIFLKSGFFFVVVAVLFSMTVNQSKRSLASIMFVETYDNVSPSLGNILTIVLLIAGLVGTVLAGKIIKFVKNQLLSSAIIFTVILPLLFLCTFVGNVSITVMVAFLCGTIVLESIEALIRTNYTMTFAKYGKSATAAGILNAAMSMSYMLAAYIIPLLVESFGWKAVIFIWLGMMTLSVCLLLIASVNHKIFEKKQANLQE
ncbi:MAG: MFS transporter [Clostridia bacterium]|nr:MFS transporter [Clostridia bacterium]